MANIFSPFMLTPVGEEVIKRVKETKPAKIAGEMWDKYQEYLARQEEKLSQDAYAAAEVQAKKYGGAPEKIAQQNEQNMQMAMDMAMNMPALGMVGNASKFGKAAKVSNRMKNISKLGKTAEVEDFMRAEAEVAAENAKLQEKIKKAGIGRSGVGTVFEPHPTADEQALNTLIKKRLTDTKVGTRSEDLKTLRKNLPVILKRKRELLAKAAGFVPPDTLRVIEDIDTYLRRVKEGTYASSPSRKELLKLGGIEDEELILPTIGSADFWNRKTLTKPNSLPYGVGVDITYDIKKATGKEVAENMSQRTDAKRILEALRLSGKHLPEYKDIKAKIDAVNSERVGGLLDPSLAKKQKPFDIEKFQNIKKAKEAANFKDIKNEIWGRKLPQNILDEREYLNKYAQARAEKIKNFNKNFELELKNLKGERPTRDSEIERLDTYVRNLGQRPVDDFPKPEAYAPPQVPEVDKEAMQKWLSEPPARETDMVKGGVEGQSSADIFKRLEESLPKSYTEVDYDKFVDTAHWNLSEKEFDNLYDSGAIKPTGRGKYEVPNELAKKFEDARINRIIDAKVRSQGIKPPFKSKAQQKQEILDKLAEVKKAEQEALNKQWEERWYGSKTNDAKYKQIEEAQKDYEKEQLEMSPSAKNIAWRAKLRSKIAVDDNLKIRKEDRKTLTDIMGLKPSKTDLELNQEYLKHIETRAFKEQLKKQEYEDYLRRQKVEHEYLQSHVDRYEAKKAEDLGALKYADELYKKDNNSRIKALAERLKRKK
jgi:hypothetical protein